MHILDILFEAPTFVYPCIYNILISTLHWFCMWTLNGKTGFYLELDRECQLLKRALPSSFSFTPIKRVPLHSRTLSQCIVSVLHQDEGGIGKSIPDARKISRDPRDFPRAKPEGNLEGRGKSGGQRGWISQYLPSFGGARTISQHQFFYREWIRKSFPVDREGLTVLKSILPCWWWQIEWCWRLLLWNTACWDYDLHFHCELTTTSSNWNCGKSINSWWAYQQGSI